MEESKLHVFRSIHFISFVDQSHFAIDFVQQGMHVHIILLKKYNYTYTVVCLLVCVSYTVAAFTYI